MMEYKIEVTRDRGKAVNDMAHPTNVYVYKSCIDKLRDKVIDLEYHPIKVMLCTSDYRPQRWHKYKSDIKHEVVSMEYTPGGVQLSSTVVTGSLENGDLRFDAADVWFPRHQRMFYTWRYAVIYDARWEKGTFGDVPENDYKRLLIGLLDLGADYGPHYESPGISWSSKGIIYMPEMEFVS